MDEYELHAEWRRVLGELKALDKRTREGRRRKYELYAEIREIKAKIERLREKPVRDETELEIGGLGCG